MSECTVTDYPFNGEVYKIHFHKKDGKGYYTVGDLLVKYELNFPIEWALNPLKIVIYEDRMEPFQSDLQCDADGSIFCSGPSECSNCATYGIINDVFTFYCANCTCYVYDGERGGEGLFAGYSITQEDLDANFPYLQGKLKEDIGDPWRSVFTSSKVDEDEDEY